MVLKIFKKVLKEILSFIALVGLLLFALLWMYVLNNLLEKFKGTKIEKFLFSMENWIEETVESITLKCEKFAKWLD